MQTAKTVTKPAAAAATIKKTMNPMQAKKELHPARALDDDNSDLFGETQMSHTDLASKTVNVGTIPEHNES